MSDLILIHGEDGKTFFVDREWYIAHHGIPGQKWGKRNGPPYPLDEEDYSAEEKKLNDNFSRGLENTKVESDGSLVLQKGSVVKRVSISKSDKVRDNKKYVSFTPEDQDTWERLFGEGYAKKQIATWNQTYVTTKDLRIMIPQEQGKLFCDMILDSEFKDKAISDFKKVNDEFRAKGAPESSGSVENITRSIFKRTDTGKAFIKAAIDLKYDAIADVYGTNTAKNPLIVLNPDSNLKKVKDPEPTKAIKRMLETDPHATIYVSP